jgi:putative protease
MQIVAPARTADIAIDAVNYGADAVYIGAPQFSAREAAGNTFRDIERAVKYAHRYRSKVYLALNTILFDHELDAARKFAHCAYDIGIDALIVQDMAFLEMDLPPVALHASTQCHNATPEKVLFLQKVGFQQVILARELSLPQIAAIRQRTTVALEAFVHGSLCVSYSGQCYLSHALTGRSANRGACAQPCRSAYNLLDAEGKILLRNKHLLSLRDLNASQYLRALAGAGVSAVKIEGRLKNADYVKNTVAYYRKMIDSMNYFAEKPRPSSGTVQFNFDPQPQKTFLRNTTNYFYGNDKNRANLLTAKALGEEIGTIVRAEPQWIQVALKADCTLANGDGVCFFDKNGQLQGTNINRIEGNKVWLRNAPEIAAKTTLYRNFDIAFNRQLAHPNAAVRQIAVQLRFCAADDHITLTATDEDNVTYCVSEHYKCTAATNAAQAQQQISAQLSKSGNALFRIVGVDLQWEQTPFFPVSQLNHWRRAVLEGLERTRESSYSVENQRIAKNNIPYLTPHLDYRANVANRLAAAFYERHGVQSIAPAFEQHTPLDAALMTCRYCILHELGKCKKQQPLTWREPLFLENNGRKLQLHFDCKRCQMLIMDNS